MATISLNDSATVDSKTYFYTVSLKKFIILQICTLGWYSVFWWFKQWQAYLQQKDDNKSQNHTFLTLSFTLLTYFFCYKFFEKADEAGLKNHVQHRWEPVSITLLFGGCGIVLFLSELLDLNYSMAIGLVLKTLMVSCIAFVQATINSLHNQINPSSPVVTPFTKPNIILFCIAPFLWLMLFFGITYESTSDLTKAKVEFSEQNYELAYKLLEEPAKEGHPEAQFLVGYLYFYGYGVQQNYRKAYRWFNRAAIDGNDDAKFFLGLMYDTGNGVSKDTEKALEYYNEAALQNISGALYELSNHYYTGDGVKQDTKKALELLQQAAEQGFVYAAYQLGGEYYNGDNLVRDYGKAALWYQKAADKGHVFAKTNLAFLYGKGFGVPLDRTRALQLYNEAANENDAVAMYNIGLSYFEGNGVKRDYQLAREWYLKSAEDNITCAFNDLGIIYASGKGVPVDPSQATTWFEKAAAYERQNQNETTNGTAWDENFTQSYAIYMLTKYGTTESISHTSESMLPTEQLTQAKTLAQMFEKECWQ